MEQNYVTVDHMYSKGVGRVLVCGRLRRTARCFTAFIIIINNNNRESTNISARCDRITALVMTPVLPDRTVRSVSSPASIRNRTMLLADTVLRVCPRAYLRNNMMLTAGTDPWVGIWVCPRAYLRNHTILTADTDPWVGMRVCPRAYLRNHTILMAGTVLLLLPTSATTRNRTVTSLPMTLTLPSADFVRRRLTAWRTPRPAAQTRTLVGGANERIGLPALSASKA